MTDNSQNREPSDKALRLNITASDLRSLLEQKQHHREYRNRRLERIVASRSAPRYWCHYAYIYPYPSLRPTW